MAFSKAELDEVLVFLFVALIEPDEFALLASEGHGDEGMERKGYGAAEGGESVILYPVYDACSNGVLIDIAVNLIVVSLRIDEAPLIATSPKMINTLSTSRDYEGSGSHKGMHDLIEICFGCMTEKMQMISHEDEGMDCQSVIPMSAHKFSHHDLPHLVHGLGKEFLIIAPASDVIRVAIRADKKWSWHFTVHLLDILIITRMGYNLGGRVSRFIRTEPRC